MRISICALSLLAFLALSITPVQADDLQPPPWRGGPLSTVAEWDFLTQNAGPPDGTSVPTVVGNGGGAPLVGVGTGLGWTPFDGSGAWGGLAPSGGIMSFEIPNWIDNEPIKFIHIQMTYLQDPAGLGPSVFKITAFDPLGINSINFIGASDTSVPGTALHQRIEDWTILPNPDRELIQIAIPANVFLSQVVIDTISVPEPSTAALGGFALGTLAVAAWVRKRNRKQK